MTDDIKPDDLIFMLKHHTSSGRHLSSFSEKFAQVLSIDPPITDDYAWAHVQCGPDMMNLDYYVRTDQIRKATDEEVKAWGQPVS